MCLLGTFSEYTVVPAQSVVKVDDGTSLDKAALVGCGVTTGYGSAVRTAETKAGDTVVVMGIGGIGINAVQGARIAGARNIIAIDPVEFKRTKALELGATHAAASLEEAGPIVGLLTRGQMAESFIITTDVAEGAYIGPALDLVAKRGKVVVTAVGHPAEHADQRLAVDADHDGEADPGLAVRLVQRPARHPADARDVQPRPAQARRADHQGVHARRSQRGLRGHAQRPQHPGPDPLLRRKLAGGHNDRVAVTRKTKPDRAERSARRDDVVRLAGQLFAQKGYRATTVREIADAAGILSGSLYHHFDSKESIGDEILERLPRRDPRRLPGRGRVRRRTRAPCSSRSSAPRARRWRSNRAALSMLQNDWNYFNTHPRFGYLRTALREIERTWISQLERGVADGVFRAELDPALTYRLLRDVLWIPAAWHRSGGYPTDQVVDAFLALLFDGITAGG